MSFILSFCNDSLQLHDLLGQRCQQKKTPITPFDCSWPRNKIQVEIDVGGSGWKPAILENVIYAIMKCCAYVRSALKAQRTEQFTAVLFCLVNRVMGLGKM